MADERKPAIILFFDETEQTVSVSFDQKQVKNWSFVKALLHMAGDAVEQTQKIQLAQALQARATDQVQTEMLARKVLQTR